MSAPVEIGPVPEAERTQSPLDLFLIFAGANIVATTLVTGASLAGRFDRGSAIALIVVGGVLGAALVASLVPVGPRLGVPSIVAARAALGRRGAAFLALVLYVTNFAWIALNNVIAASVCAEAWPGGPDTRAWAVVLGILATVVVAAGPRAVSRADRLAVPVMLLVGVLMTWACLPSTFAATSPRAITPGEGLRGLDLVVAYQVSWLLMFADYSRFTRDPVKARAAVFLSLALTSIWYMTLGLLAAETAGSPDPGAMMRSVGLAGLGALLLALATLTTNFVNIYLSALAWKSLFPATKDAVSIGAIGLVGAALSVLDRAWLDRYADFMTLLGVVLVPVAGILIARFFLLPREVRLADLYASQGPYRGFDRAAVVAWALGGAAYVTGAPLGATLPSLLVAVATYALLSGTRKRAAGTGEPNPGSPKAP